MNNNFNKSKNLDKNLSEFLLDENEVEPKVKKKIMNEKMGLIERVDKILVTSDGRQLLREQY